MNSLVNPTQHTMSLFRTKDGSDSILSDTFGVQYHSPFGAITESEHVFIKAGLQFKADQKEISILETGFGSGLNAMMSWLEAEQHNLRVKYLGLETFPLDMETAAGLNYPEQLKVPERAADFLNLHTLPWGETFVLSEQFSFEKRHFPIQDFLSENTFDVIYFDAFDPKVQPELWTETVMAHMYASLKPQGVLVTYCSQGEFRRNLKKAGFTVQKLPGVLGKWEMTRALKSTDASRA